MAVNWYKLGEWHQNEVIRAKFACPVNKMLADKYLSNYCRSLLAPMTHDTLQEQNVDLLFIFFIFESTVMAIFTRKLFPDFIVGTTGQGVSPGTTNITPQQSCKLAIGHRPQESSERNNITVHSRKDWMEINTPFKNKQWGQ